jgi:glycosyltransferase involved in cell wall biosynthesis
MHIGYDAKRAFLNNTGLGNYSRWLIRSMVTQFPDNQYNLYTPKVKANSHSQLLQKLPNTKTVTASGPLFSSWWRTRGVVKNLKRDGVQLYHGLSHELPLGIKQSGVKSVLTVHDVIFMRFPQYYGVIDRVLYRAKLQYACKVADKIIAISQKTKEDLIELLNVKATQIEVIYQGCDPAFTLNQSDAQKNLVKKRYSLPKKYLLTVGTIEERKNLLLLVKALAHTRIGMPLIVVGRATPYLNEIKAYINSNNLTGRVTFLHEVNFEDLPALYQLATAFVYPSRYEGFGIPVLEALNSGTPVIAAKGSCLEEAGGPDSLYVDPNNEQELVKHINRVWSNPALRQHMIIKGFDYARNFDHAKLSAQIMNLYQNTLKHA